MAADLAATAQIRVLLVKGRVLADQGLRAPRVSTDVDLLVDPRHLELLVARLHGVGWRQRESDVLGHVMSPHSITLVHPEWPLDLDLHDRYPGILAERGSAFETMWESRASLELAGVEVPCTGPAVSALVLALHSLFGGERDPRHERELEDLTRRLTGADAPCAVEDIHEAAVSLRAVATASPFLRSIGITAVDDSSDAADRALREWRAALADRNRSGAATVTWLARRGSRVRPVDVARLVWPPPQYFEAVTGPNPGYARLTAARLARLARAAWILPRAVADRVGEARRARSSREESK
jgi:hypothetical protein